MNIDLLPTLAGLIGADLPPRKIDGKDILPLILGAEGAKNPHESYWYYYKQNELQAVSSGTWKLVLPHTYRSLKDGKGGDGGLPAPYQNLETGLALYDLDGDPGETTDVSAANPEVVARLQQEAEAARAELGDNLTKRKGVGNRESGRLTDEEAAELEKLHWPEGRKKG